MYLDKQGNVVPDLSTAGPLAVGTPGTVAGMATLHKQLGKLSWAALVQPAVALAARGFALTAKEAAGLNRTRADFQKYNPGSTPAYLRPGGGDWQAGDTLRLPELARTLARIRDQGRAGFYEGETARLLLSRDEARRRPHQPGRTSTATSPSGASPCAATTAATT